MRAASRDGATGLYHVYSADTGPQGTLRLSISGSGFSSDQFLTPGVEESFSRGDFSIAYTPLSIVEVYANLRSTSYQNPLSSPSYLQGQGDLKLGAKASSFWGSWGAGFALNAQLYSDPQGSGWLGEATSFEMRALFTVDMTRGEAPVPFRFLLDTQFVFENSEALTAGLADEPSLIQEWGYQSARYDRLILNFGVEAPTEYISPFFSYHIGTPFLVEMPRMGQYSRIFAFESVPHQVAFGARGFARPEVALELGATIGLSDAPFTGVTATPPWTVWGGVTYTLDPRPEVMEREVKVEPPPPPKPEPPKPLGALLTLKVVDAKTGAPIKGARLSFVNEQMSALVSDDTGTITGHRIPPKRYVVAASAEGYKTRKVRLSIKEGREELKARLKLKPNKREAPAQLSISLELPPETNPNMTLELSLYGPSAQQTRLSAREPLKFSLKPGEYMLVVRDERERQHQELITLGGGGVAERVIKLSQLKRPGDASGSGGEDAGGASGDEGAESRPLKGSTKSFTFNLKRKSLRLKRAIGFAGNGAKLLRGSVSVLEKLGEFLKRERRVTKITIIVHTHSRGDAKADKRLGAKRGRAIKRVLTEAGVDAKRISIANYGSSKPLSSNITSRGRKRNQRVFIKIKSVQL